ncbi:MAG: MBL fold metallo-hydrolase [Candidatus Altiarchaeales archaeon]|nr:MBL fold metallo-hydrolase [Candidatus Altiarchaeales archaeon]
MIKPLYSLDHSANTYLVSGRLLAVIDPGLYCGRVLSETSGLSNTQYLLINTHCHFDHVACDGKLVEEHGFRLYAHKYDAEALSEGDDTRILASLFGGHIQPVEVSETLEGGGVIDLGGLSLEVLHTPGHTPGGVCLFEPESRSLFTGDTLFAQGVGRTDLAGGDIKALKQSLLLLREFISKRGVEVIYPGHGPSLSGGDLDRLNPMI